MLKDFSGKNLRGRSFKGQNLVGANFSYADIRGTDFTNANLRGANFSHAKAGLQRRWATFLVIVLLFLSAMSGFTCVVAGIFLALVTSVPDPVIIVSLIVLVFLFIATIRWGFPSTLIAISIIFAIFFGLTLVGMLINFAPNVDINTTTKNFSLKWSLDSSSYTIGDYNSIISVLFITLGEILFVTIFNAIAVIITTATSINHINKIMNLTILISTAMGIPLVLPIIYLVIFINSKKLKLDTIYSLSFYDIFPVIFRIEMGCLIVLLGALYISKRALIEDQSFAVIRSVSIAFAATGGTNFYRSNLTNVNFSDATLKNTDFRKANLTRTCWLKVKKFEFARVETTYLEKLQVRQLLTTQEGQDKNFNGLNLRGVNLQGANLVDASFIGADLSGANLQDADLSRAKLVQTQLDETDFTGATLTRVYIEDWGITSDTKFDGVRCEYVYMRQPTKENPDPYRKPDNNKEVFADGEFGDFIKPIFDTLDLYHNQGVDPRAIAISFKQLAENHPEAELRIVGMDVRGEDKFLIRAKTAPEADKSALSAEYFETYNHVKSLPEREIKLLLAEKDNRIISLENMVQTALQRPSFYAESFNSQGDIMSEKPETSTYNLNQAKFGGGFAGSGGTQSGGTLYDYSSNPILSEAAAEIQKVLHQLEVTNPTTTSADKRAVVNKAIDEIENNLALKAKIIAALNLSTPEVLKTAINHPLAKNMMPFIEELTEAL